MQKKWDMLTMNLLALIKACIPTKRDIIIICGCIIAFLVITFVFCSFTFGILFLLDFLCGDYGVALIYPLCIIWLLWYTLGDIITARYKKNVMEMKDESLK